jgi:hypothetical protein
MVDGLVIFGIGEEILLVLTLLDLHTSELLLKVCVLWSCELFLRDCAAEGRDCPGCPLEGVEFIEEEGLCLEDDVGDGDDGDFPILRFRLIPNFV